MTRAARSEAGAPWPHEVAWSGGFHVIGIDAGGKDDLIGLAVIDRGSIVFNGAMTGAEFERLLGIEPGRDNAA